MKALLRLLFIVSIIWQFSACQSLHVKYSDVDIQSEQLYLDQEFSGYQNHKIESSAEVFKVSPAMRDLVDKELNSSRNINYRVNQLIKVIFEHTGGEITYNAGANTTASETFNTREANCMSLTILAYVLAKEANLIAKFQTVKVPEYWVQNGRYSVLTGHVNLMLSADNFNEGNIFYRNSVEVDFDPNASRRNFPRAVIKKKRLLAMFYNNKGASLLIKKEFEHAYAYFKQATLADPKFSSSWSNLGILYRLTNHHSHALLAYRYAIAKDSNNLAALTNLSILLRVKQQPGEAEEINKLLLIKRKQNPYYYIMLADKAIYLNDFSTAITQLKRALTLNPQLHEAYFSLAKVYFELRHYVLSKRMMKKAIQYSKINSIELDYIAKLNVLETYIKN